MEDGRNSRRHKYRKVIKERPGLAPSALFHLIGNSVFLRLSDVASGLPDYDEQVMLTAMDRDANATGFSQKSAYEKLFEKLRHAMVKALADGSRRLLSTYLQSLLAYPDGCTRGETVFDPASGEPLIQVPPLAEDRVYPKEKTLLELVAAERLAGRRVLVYATHTGTRDITGRMDDMLTRHGFKVAVMKADSVAPERREAWLAEKVKQGVDVIICHLRLVQTGLDLVDFPTIVWYETDYSVYTMRQASRRSWRIGQTRPVKVIFMAYRNTLQADALKLVAKKLQSSLAVEGELPEDGLAAYGDDGDDLCSPWPASSSTATRTTRQTPSKPPSGKPAPPKPSRKSTWLMMGGRSLSLSLPPSWRYSRRRQSSTRSKPQPIRSLTPPRHIGHCSPGQSS